MQDLTKQFQVLFDSIDGAVDRLQILSLRKELSELEQKAKNPDFWQDQQKALATNKKIAKLKSRINPWLDLQKKVKESLELACLNDKSLYKELSVQYKQLNKAYQIQKNEMMLSGRFDDYDAILSIFAGAGGTDAQDWAEMLMRMYLRWAENNKVIINIIDQSMGEEAGIKSTTIELSGLNVYGKLRSEHGVHRLVRLSPYNSDNLRQTSFAKVDVLPKIDSPAEIEIDEKELKFDVYRAGGHGGQSVNTTDSAVRVTHLPTNIIVAIQNERSQLQNKETALTILRSKLVKLQIEQHKDRLSELKGPNEQAAWGNQIRNYVLHPYNMVKDLRTGYETGDTQAVLNGKIDDFINSYLEWLAGKQ